MKKTAITLLLVVMAAGAEAQTMYDALRFSENNYEGTARTMAMGNAFTALGGDLGSISINPAGSAVARYSQITITPGVAVSVNTSGGTSPDYFQSKYRTPMGRFSMPNIGFTINFDTYRTSGIKNWTLGFVVNRTNTYNDNMYVKGLNSNTSFAGAIASLAQAHGIDVNNLFVTDTYDPYYDSNIPFDVILGYESGIIDPIGGIDNEGKEFTLQGEYAGVNENYYLIEDSQNPGSYFIDYLGLDNNTIEQVYSRRILGNKYDYVFNFGANISDVVYFGANLGITSLSYSQEYYIREMSGGEASDYSYFQTQFNSLRYNNTYNVSGVGVYGKFGIIVTPWKGLRFGAAIQTPTGMSIRETWKASAAVSTYSSNYGNGEAETPDSEYEYELTSPFRFNVGAAYAIGNFAVISADYEMADYGGMYIHEAHTNDNSQFDLLNEDIRDLMGAQHIFRIGAEIKPVSSFAIRAGYGVTTSPEQYYDEGGLLQKVRANTHRLSCGLGYSSPGSFFADLALQATKYPDEYIYPYDYYANDGSVINPNVDTPEILSRKWLINIALTIGFRF